MAQFDPYPGGDAEREALATLLARFAADRDMLMAGVQRTEAAVGQLGARVDALTGEVAELRREQAPRDDGGAAAAALMGAVEEVRVELRRACLEMAEQATRHAERAAAGVTESSAEALAEALGQVRDELLRGLEGVQRLAVASGERSTAALAEVANLRQRGPELDAIRVGLATLRQEILGRVGEAEARFGMRIDAIVTGIEGEARAVRNAFWDRVAGAEQRLEDAEAVLAAVRAEMPRAAAEAFDGLAAVQSGLDDLRDALAATHTRLASVEASRGGGTGLIGAAVGCVRDEVVAVVMAVVSVGAVVGRLALSLLR
jgi:hypothetical protein